MKTQSNTFRRLFRLRIILLPLALILACSTAKVVKEGRIGYDVDFPAGFGADTGIAKRILSEMRLVAGSEEMKDKMLRQAHSNILTGDFFKPQLWFRSPIPSEIVFSKELIRLPKRDIFPPLDFYYYHLPAKEYVEFQSFLGSHYEIPFTGRIDSFHVKTYQPLPETRKIAGYRCKAYRYITDSGNIDIFYTSRIRSAYPIGGIALPVPGTVLGVRMQEKIEIAGVNKNIEIFINAKEITPLPENWKYPHRAMRLFSEDYNLLVKG